MSHSTRHSLLALVLCASPSVLLADSDQKQEFDFANSGGAQCELEEADGYNSCVIAYPSGSLNISTATGTVVMQTPDSGGCYATGKPVTPPAGADASAWTCTNDGLCSTDRGFITDKSTVVVNLDCGFRIVYATTQSPLGLLIAEFDFYSHNPGGGGVSNGHVSIAVSK